MHDSLSNLHCAENVSSPLQICEMLVSLVIDEKLTSGVSVLSSRNKATVS